MHDRATATKIAASLIVGNICSLVGDAKDILPYITTIIPPLKKAVIDPNPDVRRVAGECCVVGCCCCRDSHCRL